MLGECGRGISKRTGEGGRGRGGGGQRRED